MKIIQIGVGGFGRHWSKALQASADVEVVALVDVRPAALEEACVVNGYEEEICFPALEAALETVPADMVLCVSPPQFHREHITQAVAAGLHVLCEKPLATGLEDSLRILEVARATDRVVAVSQQYRYRPDVQAMAEVVRAETLGEIGQIKLDFYKGWYFDERDFRRTMPYPILVDMAVHHFDLLRFISGLEAISVRGESWNPPWSANVGDTSAAVTFKLENGARVAYNASWCTQGDQSSWNGDWIIDGDKGSLVYKNGVITLNETDRKYKVIATETIPPKKMRLTNQEYVLADFLEAVEEGRQPATSVADNVRSVGMVFAAVEAVRTGQTTPVARVETAALQGLDGSDGD